MRSIKPLPEFTAWLDSLSDASVRGVVVARIKRLALGLMGDVKPAWARAYRSFVFMLAQAGVCISCGAAHR